MVFYTEKGVERPKRRKNAKTRKANSFSEKKQLFQKYALKRPVTSQFCTYDVINRHNYLKWRHKLNCIDIFGSILTKSQIRTSTSNGHNSATIALFSKRNTAKEPSWPCASFKTSPSAEEGRFAKILIFESGGFSCLWSSFLKRLASLRDFVTCCDPEQPPDSVQNVLLHKWRRGTA